jgi:hypothetical protein
MKESRNLQRQTTAIEKQYDDKVTELTKLRNVLKELNNDQITLLTSSTSSTTVISSPAGIVDAVPNQQISRI